MEFQLYRMQFSQGVHIGRNRPSLEDSDSILHSDTLFSAMLNAWRLLYPNDLNTFFPDPDAENLDFPFFSISSAFPFHKDALFFPKPYWRIGKKSADGEDPKRAKKVKKMQFIQKELFENWLLGKPLLWNDTQLSSDGKFLWNTEDSKDERIFTNDESTRIVKDRVLEEATPFHYSRVQFSEHAGLFFLAKFESEEWQKKFNTVLNVLGDEGIGGDRSVGNGLFKIVSREKIELSSAKNAKHFVSLALLHPQNGEETQLGKHSSFALTTRRGWIHSERALQLRRKSLRFFAEGSVFADANLKGDVACVLDRNPELGLNHNVYRYGQAFNLPCTPFEEVGNGK